MDICKAICKGKRDIASREYLVELEKFRDKLKKYMQKLQLVEKDKL